MSKIIDLVDKPYGRVTREGKISKEYRSWSAIKNRCLNPRNPAYKSYALRGITVCERWKNSFENFLTDMGRAPSQKYSIDRIDNNGNYEPENCRWATKKEQANNRRTSRLLEYNGHMKTLSIWSDEIGISSRTILSRLNKKWSIEDAFTTPIITSKRNKRAF